MSNQINEYITEDGKRFHVDNLGKWYMNNSGYETLRISEITDQVFQNEIAVVVENATKSMEFYTREDGSKFTVFVNNQDPDKTNVSRKQAANASNPSAEKVYDAIQTGKPQANSTPATTTGLSTPSNAPAKSGYTPQKRDKPITQGFKRIKLTDEEFSKEYKLDPFWDIADKASQNCFMVREADGKIYWYIVLKHITFTY